MQVLQQPVCIVKPMELARYLCDACAKCLEWLSTQIQTGCQQVAVLLWQVALVMGLMLLLLRALGASIWTNLLSKPIVDSFLTAGALVIAASQVSTMAYVPGTIKQPSFLTGHTAATIHRCTYQGSDSCTCLA